MKRTILGLIGLILLISSAAALDLSASTISTPGWLIANGADSSVITVTVMDTTIGPVAGADVTFSLDAASQTLGTISPAIPVKTDANGIATAVFTAKTISGNATIHSVVSVNDVETPPRSPHHIPANRSQYSG
ncbi:MAG TPA: invasin domain 3-containing protein [Methanoregula sp.]|nr:invasin domain 3-containing protein [Methanoregula sp.]